MKVGFGIGIEYPNISTLSVIAGGQDDDNVWRFDDNTDILWEDETKVLTEE